MRIARINGSEKRIFHKDHLGSSTAITDMNGNEVEISNYMPFGSLRSHSGSYVSDYKFTDQELDDSTGLYNYGARMYDPVIGRFVTADTIVQNLSDPQTLNRYSYCRNNPLVYVDPSGHLFGIDDAVIIAFAATVVKGAAIGAAIGGTMAAVTGGDVWQGITTGAITGAFMGPANGFIGNVIAGGCAGGINAGLYGGDIGQGILSGAVFGGVSSFGTPDFQPFGESGIGSIGNRFFNAAVTGGAFGAAYAGVTGGDIWQGFYTGAAYWTAGEGVNMLIGHATGLLAAGKRPSWDSEHHAWVYKYTVKNPEHEGWITFSNVTIGSQSINKQLVVNGEFVDGKTWMDHEAGHMPQGTYYGPGYIPAQILSMTTGGAIGLFTDYGILRGSHRFGLTDNYSHPVPAGW